MFESAAVTNEALLTFGNNDWDDFDLDVLESLDFELGGGNTSFYTTSEDVSLAGERDETSCFSGDHSSSSGGGGSTKENGAKHIGFKTWRTTLTKYPRPRVPKTDYRRQYGIMFTHAVNSGDYDKMVEQFSTIFARDIIFTERYQYPEKDPHYFCGKIEGTKQGPNQLADFFNRKVSLAPDFVCEMEHCQLSVRTDGTAVISCCVNCQASLLLTLEDVDGMLIADEPYLPRSLPPTTASATSSSAESIQPPVKSQKVARARRNRKRSRSSSSGSSGGAGDLSSAPEGYWHLMIKECKQYFEQQLLDAQQLQYQQTVALKPYIVPVRKTCVFFMHVGVDGMVNSMETIYLN